MQRNTKQKQLVLEALHKLKHPTAQDIVCYIKKTYPAISLGTVYRVLASFALENKALHIKIPNKADCYDYQTHNHYHLYCKKCNKVYDIEIPYLSELNQKSKDHLIEDHSILFYGICANCYQEKEGHKHD